MKAVLIVLAIAAGVFCMLNGLVSMGAPVDQASLALQAGNPNPAPAVDSGQPSALSGDSNPAGSRFSAQPRQPTATFIPPEYWQNRDPQPLSILPVLQPPKIDYQATANTAAYLAQQERDRKQAAEEAARQRSIQATESARQFHEQQTAEAQRTQRAFDQMVVGWTATASAGNSTATAEAQANATVEAHAVETQTAHDTKEAKQVQAQQDFWFGLAWRMFLFVAALAFLTVMVYSIIRLVHSKTRFHKVQKSIDGFAAVIDADNNKAINPNLQATAVMDIKKPVKPTPEELKIKEHADQTDIIRAATRHPQQQPLPLPNTGGYQVIPPNALPPILEDPGIVSASMDADWKKANGPAN